MCLILSIYEFLIEMSTQNWEILWIISPCKGDYIWIIFKIMTYLGYAKSS